MTTTPGAVILMGDLSGLQVLAEIRRLAPHLENLTVGAVCLDCLQHCHSTSCSLGFLLKEARLCSFTAFFGKREKTA
jgi:hypothetical protein